MIVRQLPYVRAKHLYRVIDERAGGRLPTLLAVSIHHGVVPRSSLTDGEARADDLSTYKRCEPGDIVLNRMRAFQGAIGVARQSGLVSPDYLVLRPRPAADGRYLHHLFRSRWFVSEMAARLRGIGSVDQGNVRTPRINAEDLGGIQVPLPDTHRQKVIADFLDRETARIDALIAAKRRLIELVEERAAAVVETRLWSEETVQLRYVVDLLPGYSFSSSDFGPDGDGLRLLRGVNVGVGILKWDDVVRLRKGVKVPDGYGLQLNDVVLGMDRPFIAGGTRVAIVDVDGEGSQLVQRVCRLRARTAPSALIVQQALASRRFAAFIEPDLTGVSVPHLSEEQIASYQVPVVDERYSIALGAWLVQQQRQLAEIRVPLTVQIGLLAEHRHALITAAVTGELDVGVAA